MNKYAIPFLICCTVFSPKANALYRDSIPRTKTISKVRLTNGTFLDGYIIQASDSTITLVKKSDWKNRQFGQSDMIAVENIVDVTKRYKSGLTAGQGLLFGSLTGIVIGFAVGLSGDCDDADGDGKCDFVERLFATKNFGASLFLGGFLGLIGMFVGLFSRKKDKMSYHIGGSRENLRNYKVGLTF